MSRSKVLKFRSVAVFVLSVIISSVLMIGCGGNDNGNGGGGGGGGGTGGGDKIDVVLGTFVDSRDSKEYRTIEIGGRTWMAENMNYETDSSSCYSESARRCEEFGRLYAWRSAMIACPAVDGWRLSNNADWEALISAVGEQAGVKLKSESGWRNNTGSTDDYGFTVLPAGYYTTSYNRYEWIDERAYFWSSDESLEGSSYMWVMDRGRSDVQRLSTNQRWRLSVRCVRGL